MIRWGGYCPLDFRLIYGKHTFVLIVGLRVCLHCCCYIGGGHTVHNMPPLAFGIPMNNTVKYMFIVGGLLFHMGIILGGH